jgi:hypothetical protein
LECRDVLLDADESEVQTSFIVSRVFHLRFSEDFLELPLLLCRRSDEGIDVWPDVGGLVGGTLKIGDWRTWNGE